MSPWMRTLMTSPVRLGLTIGVVFGLWNLANAFRVPLADDSIAALLRFYGPMFALWGLSGAFAARRSRNWMTGVKFAAIVAFITFCVYDVLVILRVNLFLNELTGRADWQSMMRRFQASGVDSLRTFVIVEYIKGSPFKIGVFTVIGTVIGSIGAALGLLTSQVREAPPARVL
jgi:hypothetical protein